MNPQSLLYSFLILSALLAFGASYAYLISNRPGMALTFLCYCISNLGLIWDSYK